jgi:kinetochore protein NNF1
VSGWVEETNYEWWDRPHTLPAPLLLSSHLTPLHISQHSQLNAKLQTAQSQNASLAQEIGEQRKEIEALLKQAEMLVKDLEGSGALMAESIRRDGLSDRAREAEEVVMGGT